MARASRKSVDVLVAGAGPTGLVLALWLARNGVKVRVVDKAAEPGTTSRALAVQARTLEFYRQLGIAEDVVERGVKIQAANLWVRGEKAAHLPIGDIGEGVSPFPYVLIFPQDQHERLLIERLEAAGVDVERPVELLGFEETPDGVQARLKRENGREETCEARYICGCDGARSVMRAQLHAGFPGGTYVQLFYVADVEARGPLVDKELHIALDEADFLAVFPLKATGTVRLVGTVSQEPQARQDELSWEDVSDKAMERLDLEVQKVNWFSTYRVHHRVARTFRKGRAFLLGDAAHVHSPAGGQGMNTGIGDAVNLGWKLAAVLRGRCAPQLLRTYDQERRTIAKELIEFDRAWAGMLSAPLKSPHNPQGVDPAEVQDYFIRSGRYTAGTATRYAGSVLTGAPDHQPLAEGFPVGARFHSAPVVRLADAKPMQLGHAVTADGRWRLFAFAGEGDCGAEGQGVAALCRFLTGSPSSPVLRHTPPGADVDATIDVRAIFQQPHRELALGAMPALLLPAKGQFGLIDYEKIFCPDVDPRQDIFDRRGVDRRGGCIVLVRPDQYVAQVLPLDAHEALSAFFAGFMRDLPVRPQGRGAPPAPG